MTTYNVPVTINGQKTMIPVDGVDSPEAARAAVQAEVDAGRFDDFSVEKRGLLGSASPQAKLLKGAASVTQGVSQGRRKLEEFTLMAADALIPVQNAAAHNAVRKRRQDVRLENAQARDADKESFQQTFGTAADFSPLLEVAGEGMLFFPLATVAQGSTFTRAVVSNMAEGGLAGAVSVADQAKTLEDTLFTASIGSLFGAGVSIGQAWRGVRSWVGRKFAQELDSPIARAGLEMEKEVQRITNDPDFGFTVSQLAADNPWLQGLEIGARSKESLAKQNKAVQAIVNSLLKRGKTIEAGPLTTKLNMEISRQLDNLRSSASEAYEAGLGAITKKYPKGEIALDSQAYLDDLKRYVGELEDVRKIGTAPTKALRQHMEFVDVTTTPYITKATKKGTEVWKRSIDGKATKIGTFGEEEAMVIAAQRNAAEGGLDADDVISILQGHNQLLSNLRGLGDDAAAGSASAVGKRLKSSLMANIDAADASPALADIKNMQKAYLYEMNRVRTLERSSLGLIFGGSDEAVEAMFRDPSKAVEAMARMDEASFLLAKKMLFGAPELLDDMKRATMANIVAKSQSNATGTALNTTSIPKLVDNLTGTGGDVTDTVGKVGLGLFEKWEQKEIVAAAQTLRRLQVTAVTDISKDVAGVAADTGINVISRNAGFLARYIVRSVAKSANLERLMINPAARRSLIELGRKGPGTTGHRVAIAYLATLAGQWQGEDDAREALKEAQENRESITQQRQRGVVP